MGSLLFWKPPTMTNKMSKESKSSFFWWFIIWSWTSSFCK
jgi:hypothetical protein